MKKMRKYSREHSILLVTVVLFGFALITRGQEETERSSEQLLLEILHLHTQLVTNETFLAQAKMLGAYLEAAQPLEESKKVDIYSRVLDILLKIKESTIKISPRSSEKEGERKQRTFEGEQKGKSVFVSGSALLEVFKADSIEVIPKLPVIRTYWARDLAYDGGFLVPDRVSEIGKGSRYVARFSFYYEAKEAGIYGFTLLHDNAHNTCKLAIGGIDIVKASSAGMSRLSLRIS